MLEAGRPIRRPVYRNAHNAVQGVFRDNDLDANYPRSTVADHLDLGGDAKGDRRFGYRRRIYRFSQPGGAGLQERNQQEGVEDLAEAASELWGHDDQLSQVFKVNEQAGILNNSRLSEVLQPRYFGVEEGTHGRHAREAFVWLPVAIIWQGQQIHPRRGALSNHPRSIA